MGKVKKLEVLLDKAKAEYTAGEIVTGNVVLELSEAIETRGVFIQFYGAAATSDTEINIMLEVSATTRFSRQIYFDCKMCLDGDPETESKKRHTKDAGSYTFPFRFVVPLNSPSSFKGSKGKVQYFCLAEVELPRALDPFDKKKFKVHAVYDLNYLPRERVVQQLTKKVWHVLGPVTAVVRLQRSAFVPGESISINAEITNHSKVAIIETKALLKQKLRFQVNEKIMKDSNEITKMKRGPIGAGETAYWSEEVLQLPDSLPPTNLGGCDIIELQYFITVGVALMENHKTEKGHCYEPLMSTKFSVVPKTLTRPIKLRIPIIIGTVPFESEDDELDHPPTFYLPQTSIEAASVANAGFVQ